MVKRQTSNTTLGAWLLTLNTAPHVPQDTESEGNSIQSRDNQTLEHNRSVIALKTARKRKLQAAVF